MRLAFAVEVLLILSWSAIATADSELHDVSGTVLDLRHGPTEAPPTTPDLWAVHDAIVTKRYPWQKPVDKPAAESTAAPPVTQDLWAVHDAVVTRRYPYQKPVDRMGAEATSQSPVTKSKNTDSQLVDIERTMIDLSDQMEDDEAAPSVEKRPPAGCPRLRSRTWCDRQVNVRKFELVVDGMACAAQVDVGKCVGFCRSAWTVSKKAVPFLRDGAYKFPTVNRVRTCRPRSSSLQPVEAVCFVGGTGLQKTVTVETIRTCACAPSA